MAATGSINSPLGTPDLFPDPVSPGPTLPRTTRSSSTPRSFSTSSSSTPSHSPYASTAGRTTRASRGRISASPVPRGPVGEVSFNYRRVSPITPSPSRSHSAPPSRGPTVSLAATRILDDPHYSMSIEQTAEAVDNIARTVLYSPLKNGTAKYYDLDNVEAEKRNKLDRGVDEMYKACQRPGIGMSDAATNFRVNWTRNLIYYTDGGREHIKSFEEVQRPFKERHEFLEAEKERILGSPNPSNEELGAIEAEQQTLIATRDQIQEAKRIAIVDISGGELRTDQFPISGKGVSQGESSLMRPSYAPASSSSMGVEANNKAIKSIPLPASSPNRPAVVKTAMSRMFAAEKIINTMKTHLTAAKTPLETRRGQLLPDPANPPADEAGQRELAEIKHNLDILDSRLKELNSIDPDALSHVLAWYPTGADAENPQKVLQAAYDLSAKLGTEFEASRVEKQEAAPTRSWIPAWAPKIIQDRFKNEELYPSPYPAHVGGLMFSGLSSAEGRECNLDYCRAHQTPAGQDRIEDHIVRMVMRSEEDTEVIIDTLLDGITDIEIAGVIQRDQLRQQLIAEMQAEAARMEAYDAIDLSGQANEDAALTHFRQAALAVP